MDKNEFYLRLMLMQGRVLSKVRQLSTCLPAQIENVDPLLWSLGFTDQQQYRFYHVDEKKLVSALTWIDADNHFFIPYCDPRYSRVLKQIVSAPLALFVIGNVDNLNDCQLAMVGSRQFSEYGQQWGSYFAAELAINGVTITSGLAIGIDAICHKAALEVKGKTIAVLGSGLKHITPKSHYGLAKKIIEQHGTLISEFFPDEQGLPQHFPRRNRIISGLSRGVCVIEAAAKSGSLITAKYALEQGRDVFALPGGLDNPTSEGTHRLIQQGAYLVANPTDILEHLYGYLNWLPPIVLPDTENTSPIVQSLSCYPDILALLSLQPMPADMIADRIDLPITEVMVQLIELELDGWISTVSGGYIKNRARLNHT